MKKITVYSFHNNTKRQRVAEFAFKMYGYTFVVTKCRFGLEINEQSTGASLGLPYLKKDKLIEAGKKMMKEKGKHRTRFAVADMRKQIKEHIK